MINYQFLAIFGQSKVEVSALKKTQQKNPEKNPFAAFISQAMFFCTCLACLHDFWVSIILSILFCFYVNNQPISGNSINIFKYLSNQSHLITFGIKLAWFLNCAIYKNLESFDPFFRGSRQSFLHSFMYLQTLFVMQMGSDGNGIPFPKQTIK